MLTRFQAHVAKVVACLFRTFRQKFSLESEGRFQRGFALMRSIPCYLTVRQGGVRKGVPFIFLQGLHRDMLKRELLQHRCKNLHVTLTL